MHRLIVASILLAATPAVAGDITATDVAPAELPAKAKVHGTTIERIVRFADKNGTNYVVFSSTSTEKPATDMGRSRTRWLYVDHWAISPGRASRALLPVRDFEQDCPFDLTAAFVPAAFGVTDLDGDGLAEVTYGYQLSCRSDVSPATYKLLMVSNGKKYILRGETRLALPGEAPMGGSFTPDPGEKKWAPKFYAHAVAVWKATS